MVKYILRSYFSVIFFFLAACGTAYGKGIVCESLKSCEAEVTTALTTKASGLNRDIAKSYAEHGQAGFDAVFQMMTEAAGDEQEILMSAVYRLAERKDSAYKISEDQYLKLTQMWMREPGFVIGKLINYKDSPTSHEFIITALQSPDKAQKYWAGRVAGGQIGNGKSPISTKHLPAILEIIETQNYGGLARDLQRIDHPDAEIALWSLLESSDRYVFGTTYKILVKKDAARVHTNLQELSFHKNPEDRKKVLMIAKNIRQYYHRKKIDDIPYQLWNNWYNAADTSETERIIPSYLLFHLFETTKSKVDGADKYIDKRKRWRAYTQANPEGRAGYLSIESLNRAIEMKRAETSQLKPFLQLQTARLTQNETQTLQDYFDIFDAQTESKTNDVYTFLTRDFLPFPSVLDASIQNPHLWVTRFWRYIDDGAFVENSAIAEKITQLEIDDDKIKAFYLKRLKQTENTPKLLHTLVTIAKTEKLRLDYDIKTAVKATALDTPFTAVTVAADYASAITPPPEGMNARFFTGWVKPFDKVMMSANLTKKYCTAGSWGTPLYMTVPPDLSRPRLENSNQLGIANMIVKTPAGYLAGHDRGEFGGGLLYHSDITAEGQLLPLRYARNVMAITETETQGVYWALAGINHMAPGMGAVYKVDARTDRVIVTPHKRMPSVPYRITVLEDGALFMDFTAKSYTTITKDGTHKINKLADEKYNPPVILARNGELINACEG